MALDSLLLDSLIGDVTLTHETPDLADRVLSLTDRAFGPGRYVKTAERLREEAQPIADLSFVAMQGDKLLGSVRLWPIFVHDFEANTYEPLVLLGPVVVEPALRGQGIGKRLIGLSVEAAFKKGLRAVLLVGDQSYFKPFGFEKAEGITLPGPVDPNRLLILYRDQGLSFAGQVVKVI